MTDESGYLCGTTPHLCGVKRASAENYSSASGQPPLTCGKVAVDIRVAVYVGTTPAFMG